MKIEITITLLKNKFCYLTIYLTLIISTHCSFRLNSEFNQNFRIIKVLQFDILLRASSVRSDDINVFINFHIFTYYEIVTYVRKSKLLSLAGYFI